MKLTKQEMQYMVPGIYRGSIWMEPPDVQKPEGDEFIAQLTQLRHSRISVIDGYPDFYLTPDVFLEAWIAGYRDFPDAAETGCDRSYINPHAKGFELEYINWHPSSRYFSIAGRKALFADGARFNRFMIASDINHMNDQYGYMNVGINDFEHERVLVWRGVFEDDLSNPIPYDLVWKIKKQLREDLHFYVWNGKQTFPFESPNSLKSAGIHGDWTMIGFEPEELYAAFRKIDFIFPEARRT